jgi:RNA polymerase sigma-70 factor (ECF subfamily)
MSETARPRLRLVGDPDAARLQDPHESGPSSFADAFRRHYALVHRMLRVYGVDEALLDDAAQDVFVILHRRWDDYDGRTAFRSWLIGIVRRVASGYRRAGRRLRSRLEQLGAPASPASVETRLAQREELERVGAFIAQLGTRHREVFVLAELEGLTAPEIAETLGIKLNTVYSRLRVARERFAAAMARERAREQEGGKRVRTQR